ncbi:hypothetical protein KC367_g5671 [Hortaea werneckii]|nr:hypothetical protein KC367_g5671 [Hortaea werneckii]
MHWILERLRRAGDDLGRSSGAWSRACLMAFCANVAQTALPQDHETSVDSHRHLIETELQQREWLLLVVNFLTILPFGLVWIAGAVSFARNPRSRLWAFGGAIAVFLGLVSLDAALLWALIREVDPHHWTDVAVVSHLGLAAGCRLSTTSAARRLVPPPPSEDGSSPNEPSTCGSHVGQDEESKLPSEAKAECQEGPKKASQKSIPTSLQIASMIWVAAFLISMSVYKDLPLYSAPKASRDGVYKFEFILQSASSLVFVGLYAYVAYYYARGTTHLPREIIAGTLFAFTSFGTLRMISSIDTWQSWTIDGLLAFLGFNFGLFAGNRARVGVSL